MVGNQTPFSGNGTAKNTKRMKSSNTVYDVLFCKSSSIKIASVKTNKNKSGHLNNFVINEFYPTVEVFESRNKRFIKQPDLKCPFPNRSFQKGDYSCVWPSLALSFLRTLITARSSNIHSYIHTNIITGYTLSTYNHSLQTITENRIFSCRM